jgi:flagellar biosynthesis protein FlhB
VAEQEKDKTEQATPFKLQEAKRRGQVAKSLDFNSFFIIAGALGVLYGWGDTFLRQGLLLLRGVLAQAGTAVFDVPHLMTWFTAIALGVGALMAPVFATFVILMVGANLIQTGPVFTTYPLKPDPQRINPVAGFKRVFSRRMLFEGVKSVIKLFLFGFTAYLVIMNLLPGLLALIHIDPRAYAPLLLGEVAQLVFKLAMMVLIVAAIDFAYTRWDFGKRMMMSRRDIKEEVKRREGDPQVRAKLRELQREAAKRARSVSRVPEADVLITNPTHFAVALCYEQGWMAAPVLVAKGANAVALEMRRAAERHGIPVYERPALARQVFREVEIDEPISAGTFAEIARVYADVYARRRENGPRVEVRT